MVRRVCRGNQRGQSLIEFGVSVPVLLILMVGAFTYGTLISDRVISGNAARAGARTAALLGSNNCGTPGCDPTFVDRAIVISARTVAASLAYTTLTEIDIYPATCTSVPPSAACDANQYYNGDGVINRWDPNPATPAAIGGLLPFTLDLRNQTPPTELSIGVRIIYTYSPPISFLAPTLTIKDYAVMKASPIY